MIHSRSLCVIGFALLLAMSQLARAQSTNISRPAIDQEDPYERFNRLCQSYFGAEKEPLVYQKFGDDLAFVKDGEWSYVSENSAVIAWETNLPAVSHIEYGETKTYGSATLNEERPFSLHVHYLNGLEPGQSYHYRLVSADERGNTLTSEDRQVAPKKFSKATYIPDDLDGPPYRLTRPGTYVLTADIDADVSGIDIMASQVTLDLNGHTITYDKSKDAYEKVKDTEAYAVGFGPKPVGGPHGLRGSYASQKGGVRLLNGFIRQGEGAHSWWSGPISAPNMDEVAGVTMEYHGPQVWGIEAWVKKLHHNVLVDRGTKIPNRHQGTGAIEFGSNAHHNLIKRARHRGIDGVNGGKIYRNEIYIDSFATNAAGVNFYATRNAVCEENRIFGTGYHFIGVATISFGVGDIKVAGNFIHGRTLKETGGRWSEYGDQSGVNGLRVNWGGENIEWSDNIVVVDGRGSANGEVRGVWHVPDDKQQNLVYHHNTIKAIADPEKTTALGAVVISGGKHPEKDFPGLFRNNVLISNFSNVSLGGMYYGDGTNGRFVDNTFVRIGDREDYRSIQGGVPNGEHSSCGHVFIDSNFKDTAAYDKVAWRGDGEFSVGWTVTVRTAAGTEVTIRDKTGQTVFSGETDANGVVQTALMHYRHSDRGKTMLTPHIVTIQKGGKVVESEFTADRIKDVVLSLDDPSR